MLNRVSSHTFTISQNDFDEASRFVEPYEEQSATHISGVVEEKGKLRLPAASKKKRGIQWKSDLEEFPSRTLKGVSFFLGLGKQIIPLISIVSIG